MKQSKHNLSYIGQNGMTLLELTVVLLILTTLATIALRSTSALQDQARWEQTKSRYEEIKKAIIGDPKLLINGQPDISGFVADMGRLPRNIHELLEKDYCEDNYSITVDNFDDAVHASAEDECNATYGAGSWKQNFAWFIGCSDGLSADESACNLAGEIWHSIPTGWNGPYLLSSQPAYDLDAFVDGWGRLAQNFADQNYGWGFCLGDNPDFSTMNTTCFANAPLTAGTSQLAIKSYSKDSLEGGVDIYDKDYPIADSIPVDSPNKIKELDWKIDISGGVMVNIQPSDNGYCDITTPPNQVACEAAGQLWDYCQETSQTNQTDCENAGLTWYSSAAICVDTSKDQLTCTPSPLAWNMGCGTFNATTCNSMWQEWNTTAFCSNSNYIIESDCTSNSAIWFDANTCLSKTKNFCETQLGNYARSQLPITMKITYRNGGSDNETASSTITINENGRTQIISFSGFVDTSSNPVNRIPKGNNLIEIEDGTGNLYPISNNPITISFIPHKTLPTIIW